MFFKKYLNILFILSGITMTLLLSSKARISHASISVIISSIFFFILIKKYDFANKQISNKEKWIVAISIFFSLIASKQFSFEYFNKIALLFNYETPKYLEFIALNSLRLIALFATTVFFVWALSLGYKAFKNFIKSLNKFEIKYLIITSVIAAIAIPLIFSLTNVFYNATSNNVYDHIYTTDSTALLRENIYLNINAAENDIRNPLFGLLSMPFSIIADISAYVINFIPNSYALCMQLIQVFLLIITNILIARMLKLPKKETILFLIIMSLTFPFLLFSLIIEQYIISLFYMVLFIYAYINKKENKDIEFIGASGTLLTSGILFPLLISGTKILDWIKQLVCTGLKVIGVFFMFGRGYIILTAYTAIINLSRFSSIGKSVPFYSKIQQFTNFVSSCFFGPKSYIDTELHVYKMTNVTAINMIGTSILIMVLISFILNYKDKLAKICLGWIAFSFLLLCVAGWGTMENGLILYSLYFGWAYVTLIFMLVNKIFNKLPKIKYGIFISIIIILIVINFPFILNIIQFGRTYYPTT